MQYHARHDASVLLFVYVVPLHRVGLSRTGLPVGHNGPIVAITDTIQDWLSYSFENFLLGAFKIKDVIEDKWDLFASSIFVDN
jgi:hypothetical protein